MKEYKRAYPLFSLCGLNCGLCPRFHTEGASKCPGCGGPDFHLKHPACAVITCSRKHGEVEYCFQCSGFPCERYSKPNTLDSFISYRNILADCEKAQREGLEQYKSELNEKVHMLEILLRNYNDGRRKSFYCLAVNLLSLADLKGIEAEIRETIDKQDGCIKDKAEHVVGLCEAQAKKKGLELKLRK